MYNYNVRDIHKYFNLLLLINLGYWVWIDTMFKAETICIESECSGYHLNLLGLEYLYGDIQQPYKGLFIDYYDVYYESQFKVFYVGYSFFIIGLTATIAYDMDIIGNYKKVIARKWGWFRIYTGCVVCDVPGLKYARIVRVVFIII